jgi:hypothetical protein
MSNRQRRGASGPVWRPDFEPPPPPRTERLQLAVLGPDVAELDHVAILGSRVRLRDELRWGGWPADGFSLADNIADLAEHRAEFDAREAFAYTVLDPSGETTVGCVYLEPWDGGARLAWWVIDAELDTGLESHLLSTVATWLCDAWPPMRVLLPVRRDAARCRALLQDLGLPVAADGPRDHDSFVLVARG